MGIFDGIEDEVRRGPECRVVLLRARLDKDDLEAFDRVLGDATIPATLIARRLTAAGHMIKDESLARHRRGACACKP